MKHITTDELRQMAGTEGLILQGCGGDPQEWLSGVNEMLTQEGILLDGSTFKDAYVFGHEGLTNILFSMEDVKLDIGKLAIWRLASHDTFGGTWLSDYLPNRLGIGNNEPDIAQPPTPFVDVAPATAEDAPVAEQSPVMQVYIENATDPSIGGFTIPLPTTTEKLRPWLEAIGIGVSGMEVDILDFRATILGLQDSISEMGEKISLEELNYLAEKIANLNESDRVVLSAVLEAERHCGNVAQLINLTQNLDRFHLQPAFSEEQYGEFLVDMAKDDTSAVFNKLEKSGHDDERNFAKHILRLEAHVDYAAYGHTAAEEEGGVFTKQGYVTSYYGWRVHPISGEKDYHKGIDIGMPSGTEILATHDGKITFAGDSGGYGLVVVLEDNKGLTTKYAHCSQLLVSAGQEVKKGDSVAKVGSTGNSTGPHLHFEVIYNGHYLNPLFFSETGDDGSGRILPGQPGGVEFPAYPGAPMSDGAYAALMAEAQEHLGKPYVFGAKGPNKFDCSGFVCWSFSKSGIRNIGTNAQGLYNASTPVSRENAQPGDLIFFKGTYSTHNTVTHVGIYIGNGQMIHAGKPIQYASIDTRYWREHFYSFGRIN